VPDVPDETTFIRLAAVIPGLQQQNGGYPCPRKRRSFIPRLGKTCESERLERPETPGAKTNLPSREAVTEFVESVFLPAEELQR